jgi:hypothetical protein
LVLKEGQWFDGSRAVAEASSGRWVAKPDGVYVDPVSQRVFALATVEGRSSEAFALAEVHAKQALGLAAEPVCKEVRATEGVPSPKTAMEQLRASQPTCPCSTYDVFARVSGKSVRVAVLCVAGAFLVYGIVVLASYPQA